MKENYQDIGNSLNEWSDRIVIKLTGHSDVFY